MWLWIKSALSGREKLWTVFWIAGIGFQLAITLLILLLSILFPVDLLQLLWATLAPIYMIVLYIALWKCSPNVDKKIWMHLMRGYIILLPLLIIVSIVYLIFNN
jgi:hypothetical protein